MIFMFECLFIVPYLAAFAAAEYCPPPGTTPPAPPGPPPAPPATPNDPVNQSSLRHLFTLSKI